MKINQTNVSTEASKAVENTQARFTERVGGRPAGAGRPVEKGDPTDHISLSRLSRVLMASALDNPAQARRVESLAALYRSGTYQVDAAAVSRKMVEDSFRSGGE